MTDTSRTAADLELIYALRRHPQQISTFVNGEAAILAPRVGNLRIVAEKRSPEPDLRPGGIPDDVDVQWTPKRREPAFWHGSAVAFARHPRAYLAELSRLAGPGETLTAKRRWAYSFAAAAAYAARLPTWRGHRHVHAHFATEGALIAHAISRLRCVPYSITVHGSADLFRENPHLGLLARDAAFVVAVSAYHRDHLLESVPELPSERVIVIHIGVRSDALATAAGTVRQRDPARETRILSVGNLVPYKGMPVLVEAIGRLVAADRAVRLDIIGEGVERPRLEALISELGLGGRVTLHGVRTPADVHAAMRDADLFVLASVRTAQGAMDGVPTVLMEAMASGLPAISTRLSGIPELIEDGSTGWLAEQGDPDSLAAAIADAIDHPEEAARRAEAGRGHVRDRFDQERNALALLDRILATGGAQNASR